MSLKFVGTNINIMNSQVFNDIWNDKKEAFMITRVSQTRLKK